MSFQLWLLSCAAILNTHVVGWEPFRGSKIRIISISCEFVEDVDRTAIENVIYVGS